MLLNGGVLYFDFIDMRVMSDLEGGVGVMYLLLCMMHLLCGQYYVILNCSLPKECVFMLKIYYKIQQI